MEDLPGELKIDILSRLPVKTIIHCKLVCKKWRNLVSDRFFANLHLSRSPIGLIIHYNPLMHLNDCRFVPDDPGILKWVEIEDKVDHDHLNYDRLLSLDLNLAPILQKTRIRRVGSVDGLICLWQYSPKHDDTYICNPVTREYMILPRQHFRTDGFPGVFYCFGMSSLTREYKVVRVFQTKVVRNCHKAVWSNVLETEVYTLGTGQWRSLGRVHVTYWLNTFQQFCGPFLNNHCHWIVSDNEDSPENICTFDLDKETFQLFPSPPLVKENRVHLQSLAILKGSLCKLDTDHFEVTIWVMKEYGIKSSWHREVVIRREICGTQWSLYEPIDLIAGLKDGRILMVCEDELCVFDPRSETIKVTKTFEPHVNGLTYCPSFLKLQNFESEMVHMF